MENWENLQDRVCHLGWLAEELPDFVRRARGCGSGGAWLFRELAREAQMVADTAAAFVGECEKAGLSGPGGDTPDPPPWRHHPDRGCGGLGGRDRPPDTGCTAGGGGVA
ncbi:MAG TPA: hypothetical protein VE196_05560 [Pseudonocardiaceae bacterium]|nr:hypothetical protein [Pseudonocardiaceae bacterium]